MQENNIQSKQINRLISGYINIPSVTIPIGVSNVNSYTAISSVINTAAYKGKPLELKQSVNETEDGLIFTSPNNIVLVNTFSSNRKIFNNRAEVYGKITYVNPTTFTLTFYYLDTVLGEQFHTFSSEIAVSLKVPYRYLLHQLPTDVLIELKSLFKGEVESSLEIAGESSDTWKSSVVSIVSDPTTITPTEGQRYIIGEIASGIFTGKEDQIATFSSGAWSYTSPNNEYTVKIVGNDQMLYQYSGNFPSGSWITQPFLTSILGNPTTGSWSDGLFDFENTITVDAISELNKFMAALAPPAAPILQSWNETTCSPKITGRLSFDTTHPTPGYSPADAVGIINPVAVAQLFQSSGKRLGITTGSGIKLSGIFNDNVPVSPTTPTPSYSAYSFRNANKGVLNLYINGVIEKTIDLTSSTAIIDETSGGTATGLWVSSQKPAYFASGVPFENDAIQHRTGSWVVTQSSLNNGYNNIVVEHVVDISTTITLVTFDVLVDSEITATTITNQTFVINSMTGIKYLSGVGYYTGGTANYSSTINNAYKNTYSPDSDAISHTGVSCTAPSQALPANTGSVEQVATITNKLATITASRLLNGSISLSSTVKRTVQSTFTGSVVTITGILLDSVTATNTDKIENFTDESRRLKSNIDFENYSLFETSSKWDSEESIKDGNASFINGLQVINGRLYYPGVAGIPNDFRTVTIPNSPVWNNGGTKGTARNYTGLTGDRTYYRFFKQLTPTVANFILNIKGSSVTFISASGSLTGNNCRVELKAPSQTGWLDCYLDFETEKFLDGNGCRSASTGAGRLLNTNWGLTIGTKNTSFTGGYIVLKLTVGQSFAGYINEINFQFG